MSIPGVLSKVLRFGADVLSPLDHTPLNVKTAASRPYGTDVGPTEDTFKEMQQQMDDLLTKQFRMQSLSQEFSAQSNIAKTEHETAMNTIRNVR